MALTKGEIAHIIKDISSNSWVNFIYFSHWTYFDRQRERNTTLAILHHLKPLKAHKEFQEIIDTNID